MRLLLTLLATSTCLASAARAQSQSPETMFERAGRSRQIREMIDSLSGSGAARALLATDMGRAVATFARAPLQLNAGRVVVPSTDALIFVQESLAVLAANQNKPVVGVRYGLQGDGGGADQVGTNLLGLPSEADIILGLADFLIERAREELVQSYMLDLEAQLGTFPIVANIAPRSVGVVRSAGTVRVQAFLPALRSAAREDISQLPTTLTNPKTYPDGMLPQGAIPRLQYAGAAVRVFESLRKGAPPALALSSVSALSPEEMSDPRVRYGLSILGTLAREYQLSDGGVARLLADPYARRYFVAFLAHDVLQARETEWTKAWVDAQVPRLVGAQQLDVAQITTQLHSLRAEVDSIRRSMSRRDTTRALADAYVTVIELSSQLMGHGLEVFWPDTKTLAEVRVVLASVDRTTALARSLIRKDYGGAAVEGLTLIRDLAPKALDGKVPMRYMTLVSGIASAQSPEDVTTTLYAVAEPVGAFREKRGGPEYIRSGGKDGKPRLRDKLKASVTLNAYLGAGGGSERTLDGADEDPKPAGQFGLAAPIGLEIALGRQGALSSISLFLPIIDLGNVASFRLSGDEVEKEPEIGFQQVLAPGAMFVFGLSRNRPLSLGAGIQLTSRLREEEGTGKKLDVIKASAFLGVDIPLLRF